MLQLGNDASTFDEDGLLEVLQELALPSSSQRVLDLGVIVVPVVTFWKSKVDLLHVELMELGSWLGNLWCDQDVVSKHELGVNSEEERLFWEFVPHDSP